MWKQLLGRSEFQKAFEWLNANKDTVKFNEYLAGSLACIVSMKDAERLHSFVNQFEILNSEQLFNIGNAFSLLNLESNAKVYYLSSIQLKPELYEAWYRLIKISFSTHDNLLANELRKRIKYDNIFSNEHYLIPVLLDIQILGDVRNESTRLYQRDDPSIHSVQLTLEMLLKNCEFKEFEYFYDNFQYICQQIPVFLLKTIQLLLDDNRVRLANKLFIKEILKLEPQKYGKSIFNLALRCEREDLIIDYFKQHENNFVLSSTLLILLGNSNLAVGNSDIAKSKYRKALEIEPNNTGALYSYSTLTKEEEINILKDHISTIDIPQPSTEQMKHVCYAKYVLNDHLSEYHHAFEFLKQANQYAQPSKYTIETTQNDFKILYKLQSMVSNCVFQDFSDAKPMFIVGMPRSGTSLLSKMLDQHSQILAIGESTQLNFSARKEWSINNVDQNLRDIMENYSENVIKVNNNGYVVDKMPLNYRWIPIILKCFPNSIIINMCRAPMDIIWSNYRILFREGHDFTYSLRDLYNYHKLYVDLMEAYTVEYGERIITLEYEKLVSDPQKHITNILGKAQLNWEPSILKFHLARSMTRTASASQVTKPLYVKGKPDWLGYSKYILKENPQLERFI